MPSECCPHCGSDFEYIGDTMIRYVCGSWFGRGPYSDKFQDSECKFRIAEKRVKELELILQAYRELPESYHQGMLELLVRCAFECGEISHGRAAELLKENVQTFKERGWNQYRYN